LLKQATNSISKLAVLQVIGAALAVASADNTQFANRIAKQSLH
jgi:hypothetical protein